MKRIGTAAEGAGKAREPDRSSTHGTSYPGLSKAARITRAGKALSGGYRSDQFADPETFALEVATLFEQYEIEVVEYLVDIRNHDCLQRRYGWPPSIKEIDEALDDETAKRAKRRAEAWVKPPKYIPPPPRTDPGCRANVFIPAINSFYGTAKQFIDSGEADRRDYRVEAGGVWLNLGLYEKLRSGRIESATFKPMTDDELRAYYGRREAEAAKQEKNEPDRTE